MTSPEEFADEHEGHCGEVLREAIKARDAEWQARVNAARVEGFLEGIKSTASHADERADAVERSPMASSPWAKAVAPALRVFAKDMRESADEAMAEVAPLTPAAPRGD